MEQQEINFANIGPWRELFIQEVGCKKCIMADNPQSGSIIIHNSDHELFQKF